MRFSLVTLALVFLLIAASVWGGYWIWGALFYVSIFAYAVDRLAPVLLENAPDDAEFPVAAPLSLVLGAAHFVVLFLALVSLVHFEASVLEKLALFLAVSLFSGQVGHPNAHELIHQPNRRLRQFGRAVYMSLLIGHHASAHPLVHHVHVGTVRDPVSAPKGRGFWRFFGKAWVGSYRAGYAAETARLKEGQRHPYLSYHFGAFAVLIAAYALAEFKGVLICAAIGIYAQLQIFLSDYVQHYGLRRRILENGKPEPVGPQHSWNTPHRFSGAMMLNAPRHSDHHAHPMRQYPALRLDADEMPMLPYSLPMMALIAFVPPLWRRVMDPRVAAWSGQ